MKASNVIFDEVEHTYHLYGKKLKGITGTLIPHAIGQKYADVPEHILEEKAKYGKRVHSEIEMYLNGFEPSNPTSEFLAFKKWQLDSDIKFIKSEFIVSDNANFATPIDAIDNENNLYDWKTTYVLDLESLSWQLSICAYFNELQGNKVNKLYALHLRGLDEPNLVEIERIPNSEVQRLIECYLNDEPYVSSLALNNEEAIAEIYELDKLIVEIESEAKKYKALKEQMSEFITKQMEKSGIKTFETEKLKVKMVRKGYLKLTIK